MALIEKCLAAAGAAVLITLTLAPSTARAEGPVSPKGKGIVGGALLGAEVVDLTIAIAGVEKGWPYFVFGAVGAGGGAVGGYFVEQATYGGAVEAPVFMLVGGMALVIPTIVASLNATSFKPVESEHSEPLQNLPSAVPPPPSPGVALKLSQSARPHLPLSVVDVYDGHLAVGVPAVEIRPVYTQREMAVYGVDQKNEVRVPVFKAFF